MEWKKKNVPPSTKEKEGETPGLESPKRGCGYVRTWAWEPFLPVLAFLNKFSSYLIFLSCKPRFYFSNYLGNNVDLNPLSINPLLLSLTVCSPFYNQFINAIDFG